ncbi:MAG: cell division protein ZapA [Rhizobiaceae bacterium]|nr:cell division protein ZapA [Rhizobiaceae bacterium]
MAQVVVTIDGKAYRMACEEGQEAHLEGLAQNFDRYVGHLKSQFGEIGDLRLTVMAAIMIMDELSEANRRIGALDKEVEAMRQHRDSAATVAEKSDQALAGMLTELTTQVRSIADKLNGPGAA